MNAQIQQFWELNRMYTPLRDQLMDELSDDDLSFTPGGSNPTLGELCRELGETENAYVQSFKTYKADFSYRSNDDSYLNSVSRLQAWYAQLDEALESRSWRQLATRMWQPSRLKETASRYRSTSASMSSARPC